MLLVPRTRRLGALAADRCCTSRCSRPTSTWCGLWWDKPWPMKVAALARLPFQLPMITKALSDSGATLRATSGG